MLPLAFADRLALLPCVSLEELDAQAALLTRRDRKYLVPMAVAERVVTELAALARVLEIDGRRQFGYESVYFDTPEHMSYLNAARRRPRRFKVRTRAYLDTGRCVLEVKTRDARGRTVKTQHDKDLTRRDRLDAHDRLVVGGYPEIGIAGRALEPAVTTRYTRVTLLVGADARATLDTDVTAIAPDGRAAHLADMAIIESKSAGAPSPVDRLLWSLGHRPIRVSKFGTGLAALFPELPSNKWHRALGASWEVGAGAGALAAG
ncbi:MAG: polyphosphate polymerase domain-containing protein [Chloroflexota bacterium]